MRNFDEETITQAVLGRLRHAVAAGAPGQRSAGAAPARFIREVDPTFDEWQQAIHFLTDTGHRCSDMRQEFILLSDTLGVSMLVDAINHRRPGSATRRPSSGPSMSTTRARGGQRHLGRRDGDPMLATASCAARTESRRRGRSRYLAFGCRGLLRRPALG